MGRLTLFRSSVTVDQWNGLVIVAFIAATYWDQPARAADLEEQRLTAAQAKALALKVHAAAAAMDRLPRLSYRIKSGNGTVDTLRDQDELSVAGLKAALDGPVARADWLQRGVTLAWTDKYAVWSTGDREGPRFSEESKTWRQHRVWTKDRTFERSGTPGQPSRFIYTPTANKLWEGQLRELAYFRVTPHTFWWATSNHHHDMISSIPPDEASYQFIATEEFDDELCDVVESPSRAERLWIGRESGRLRGVLTSRYRGDGPKDPFYENEQVQKIAGRSFATRQEYGEWHLKGSGTPRQRMEIARLWNELHFDLFGPNELIRFRDYREVAPGVWIPFREDRAFTHPAEGDRKKHRYIRLWVAVDEIRTDVDLADAVKSLEPKNGEQIQDQRFGVVVNYQFQHDRTQGELLALIEAERQKQAVDAEVVTRAIAPVVELIGKPAPVLPTEGWLGGPPPKLADRPYLVHFWATWCGPCKNDFLTLKTLTAEGFLVIGLHPAGTSAAEVGKLIDDQEMGYPTYLASAKTAGDEQKIAGYPVSVFPYCILVDRTGKVTGHGSLGPDVVANLRALLKQD